MTVVARMFFIPESLSARMAAFAHDRKTGSITLDIKNGQILAWRITETGRLDKDSVDNRNHVVVE